VRERNRDADTCRDHPDHDRTDEQRAGTPMTRRRRIRHDDDVVAVEVLDRDWLRHGVIRSARSCHVVSLAPADTMIPRLNRRDPRSLRPEGTGSRR
jgi:hypothetical protein